jgi:hypothetical protein
MMHGVEAIRERECAEGPDQPDDGQATQQAVNAAGKAGAEEHSDSRRCPSPRKIPPAHALRASFGLLRKRGRYYIVKRYTDPVVPRRCVPTRGVEPVDSWTLGQYRAATVWNTKGPALGSAPATHEQA